MNMFAKGKKIAKETKTVSQNIGSNVIVSRLKFLHEQLNSATQNHANFQNAVQNANISIATLTGAINEMQTVLKESGINVEEVYQKINEENKQKTEQK